MSRKSHHSSKPITPRLHGLIDYGLAAGNVLLPRLLRLPPAVTGVFAAFGAIQSALNAWTAQPYAAQKVVPFRVHGAIEKASLPLYVLAPVVAGVTRNKKALVYWVGLGAALVTIYNLTDWDAKKTDR